MKCCPQCNLRYPTSSAFCFVDGCALIQVKDRRIGTTLHGRYVLEDVVGKGGMAVVYRARHKLADRPCAVKLLNAQLAQDPVSRERFRREARHAQRLSHPNIIEVFDEGQTEDGTLFLVMELLQGQTLCESIASRAFSVKEALHVSIQMMRALARAHDFEVVHRDLKPENVFILTNGQVKLLDFGIARCADDVRLTNRGDIFGTPEYMAPERLLTGDAGPSSDLYAFGLVLFEMLTQTLPFESTDSAGLMIEHMRSTPKRLTDVAHDMPPILDDLIAELLAKDPSARPPDAHRVLHRLYDAWSSLGLGALYEPEPPRACELPSASSASSSTTTWKRRRGLFERMLDLSREISLRESLGGVLEGIRARIDEISGLHERAHELQENLADLEFGARDIALNLGRAMDILSQDASKAREEARLLHGSLAQNEARQKELRQLLLTTHRQAIHWEGRSAFVEPSLELAAAYRDMAGLLEDWHKARTEGLALTESLNARNQKLGDLEYQIHELRASLAHHEETGASRTASLREQVSDLGLLADKLENELLELSTQFCAPLRHRAELGILFDELAREARVSIS